MFCNAKEKSCMNICIVLNCPLQDIFLKESYAYFSWKLSDNQDQIANQYSEIIKEKIHKFDWKFVFYQDIFGNAQMIMPTVCFSSSAEWTQGLSKKKVFISGSNNDKSNLQKVPSFLYPKFSKKPSFSKLESGVYKKFDFYSENSHWVQSTKWETHLEIEFFQ